MNRLIEKVRYEYGAWEFAFYILSSSRIPPSSSLVPFTSVVEWRRSLDQCCRPRLRVHQQWRNYACADKPCRDERRGEIGPRCRPHFPCPAYLGAKHALSRRTMGRVGRSNAAVQNPADNRLGNLSRGGGFRCLGTSDRVSSTGCRAYPRKQRVYDQQRSAKRCD
jgi:hypothetical protein